MTEVFSAAEVKKAGNTCFSDFDWMNNFFSLQLCAAVVGKLRQMSHCCHCFSPCKLAEHQFFFKVANLMPLGCIVLM